jgi:PAS domain S-box-containing protein
LDYVSKHPVYENLEFIPDAIVIVGPDGRIRLANTQAERLFGYSRADLTGQRVEVLLPERFRRGHEEHRADYAREPRLRPMGAGLELYGRRRNGEEFPVDIMLNPIESGDETLTLGVIRDITDRKLVEAALRESEARFRLLVEAVTDYAIYMLDLEGRVVSWTEGAERITGYRAAEAIGLHWSVFYPREEMDRTFEPLRIAASQGRFEDEGWRVRKDGSRYWANSVMTALRGQDGQLVGFSRVTRDLSERKENEEALRVLHQNLEAEVQKRTAELVQANDSLLSEITERRRAEEVKHRLEEQLQQSQKMEAVGRLAGGVAHDFNNLLTGIMAFTELLLEHLGRDDPLREGAQEALKSCERSARLTRQLLALSRRQALEPVVLDLNAVLADMTTMLRSLIGEDVDFVTALDPTAGPVRADAGMIEQVILNLVVNARDAMPMGGRLTITTADIDVDDTYQTQHPDISLGPYVVLSVSDTGVGMDSEVMAHIFEPFFTTKERGKGTGLGLSTVYGVVKQSGGSVWVYSEPGQGTTFKIYFPRVDESVAAAGLEKKRATRRNGAETVLVAEDDSVVRITVCSTLRSHGYKVLEASQGEEALSVAADYGEPIHLLLTDVVMPRMGGAELAEHMSRARPATLTLYMSAHLDDSLIHRGIFQDGARFLEKPFTRDQLLVKVRQVLDGPQPETG